ncbi:unnamed protein product [Orchesella dallaii]|uniref:BTB domain-containing protein n=1 Tax=Orchesella dallaii TaxID=48710 RepID=A0ABP1R9F7_9HEXA
MDSSCGVSTERGSSSGGGTAYLHHPILDHPQTTLTFGYPMSASQSKDDDDSWKKIFPIGKNCGVNLQTPVFEFKEDDSSRQYQLAWAVQVDRETSHSQKSRRRDLGKGQSTVGYFSLSLTVIVTKNIEGVKCGDEEEYAMFVIGLCNCETCSKKMVNTLEVEPMEVTMKLGYFKDLARNVLLSFFPGVTGDFDMKEEASRCRRPHLVYYSSFLPLSKLNIYPFKGETFTTYVFRERREGEASRFMSKWTPSVVEIIKICGMKPLIYEEEMKRGQPDMELVSSEGKHFPCHQRVLSVQSPVFEDKLFRMPMDRTARVQTRSKRKLIELPKFELTENSLVTEVFIKCLYNPDILQFLRPLELEAIVGVLQLASQYQLMNLLGIVSTLVVEKLKSGDMIEDVVLQRKIYEIVEANSTIQTVFQLRETFLNGVSR